MSKLVIGIMKEQERLARNKKEYTNKEINDLIRYSYNKGVREGTQIMFDILADKLTLTEVRKLNTSINTLYEYSE